MIRRSYINTIGPSGATAGQVPLPSTNPGSVGVATSFARSDHTHPPDVWATGFINVTTDRTTTSLTDVAFGSVNNLTIPYANSKLLVWFSGGCSNSAPNQNVTFTLYIDGSPVKTHTTTCRTANSPFGIAFQWSQSISVGAHTAQLFWRVNGGTGQVRTATFPDTEHIESISMFVIH